MALVVIICMLLCCTVRAGEASLKHHPKFRQEEGNDVFKQEVCSSELDQLRNEVIEKASCGEPKEMLVELNLKVSYLTVMPRAVWVKRCAGLCGLTASERNCVPTKTGVQDIPVRIHNAKTNKEMCASYHMEVHESCGCCEPSGQCDGRRVYNPRKCSCQCPNMEERRSCLKKRNQNLRWNRSKCTCEAKRRVKW